MFFSRNPGVDCLYQTRSQETPGSLIQALRDDEQKMMTNKRSLLRHSGNAFKPESSC